MSSVSILPTPCVHIQLHEWSPWRMWITHFFLILFTNIWVFPAPLLDLVIVVTSAVTARWLRVTNIPKENSVSFEFTNLRASYLTGLKKLDEDPSSWSLASVAFLLFLLACFSWSPGKTASSVVFYASHGGLAGSRHSVRGSSCDIWVYLTVTKLFQFSACFLICRLVMRVIRLTANDIDLVAVNKKLGCVVENELWIKGLQWPSICVWMWGDLWGMQLCKKAECVWCGGIGL